MIRWLQRLLSGTRAYERGYVAGWDAAEHVIATQAATEKRLANPHVSLKEAQSGIQPYPPLGTPNPAAPEWNRR